MKPWSEMTPRERNILVGTTLFNLTPVEVGEYLFYETPDNDNILDNDFPNYTESIFAAWEVTEKFEQVHLVKCLDYYACIIDRYEEVGSYRSPKCKTMPEAICLAALRAVGVEV